MEMYAPRVLLLEETRNKRYQQRQLWTWTGQSGGGELGRYGAQQRVQYASLILDLHVDHIYDVR